VPRLKVPIIVGVAGASGSGKTSIATLISEALNNELKIIAISMDNYYKGLPKNTDASVYNWDHPEALDMELLASHLRALHRGEDVHVPHYDFSAHARRPSSDSTEIRARETDVVIIDGIFVLAVPAVRAACDLTLFTVEDLDVCLARRLRRDIAERGRSVDSVLEQYTRFVKPGFHNFIQVRERGAGSCVPSQGHKRAQPLLTAPFHITLSSAEHEFCGYLGPACSRKYHRN
jgi:uridine kinase